VTRLEDLETPCLVLDRDRVTANAARLRGHLAGLGVPLRLHVKTAKCPEVIALVLAGTKAPVTVSTLKEAEQFFAAGYRDILYAVGFEPHKLARAQALAARGARLTLLVDNVESAQGIKGFPVLIEIDTDGHRAGVKPDNMAQLLAIAQALERGGCTVAGVLAHAGDSYNSASVAGIKAIAGQERDGAVMAAQALRKAGFAAPVVSIGSTPTATYAQNLADVTEVRAGVFVFFDLVMAGIDVCKPNDIALSVLATVTGRRADKGWILIDAGWMALSRDRGTARQRVDQGYGVVCDLDGRPIPGLIVTDANQEHGIVARRDGGAPPELGVGTRLRILPNHACATGAQHERYHVVDGGHDVAAVWQRFSGW
jgi:D-serine deaminase-like pyridoxal phosphate-dependent protein